MKTINLARKEYGNVNYKIHKFPDGQYQLEILDCLCNVKDKFRVVSRLCNGDDLFILLQLDDIMRRNGLRYDLYIPYLIGSRCDRLFSYNQSITIDIVINLLRELNCNKIEILDPHSSRSLDSINCIYKCNWSIINQLHIHKENIALPDEGSIDRFKSSPSNYFIDDVSFIYCSKIRDQKTNKLSGFRIDRYDTYIKDKPIYLVDDLCDGGGTFLGLAEKLRELNPVSLNLVVTHAIQTDGLSKVSKVYDKVYITNSFADWDLIIPKDENIKVFDVLR